MFVWGITDGPKQYSIWWALMCPQEIWLHLPNTEGGFQNVVSQRLQNQSLENWRAKIRKFSRYTLLNDLKPTFERSPYIDFIQNHKTRLIFIRLCIDMNVFSDYTRKKHILGTATCSLCIRRAYSIQHILLHCPYLKEKHEHLYRNIELQLPWWQYMDDDMQQWELAVHLIGGKQLMIYLGRWYIVALVVLVRFSQISCIIIIQINPISGVSDIFGILIWNKLSSDSQSESRFDLISGVHSALINLVHFLCCQHQHKRLSLPSAITSVSLVYTSSEIFCHNFFSKLRSQNLWWVVVMATRPRLRICVVGHSFVHCLGEVVVSDAEGSTPVSPCAQRLDMSCLYGSVYMEGRSIYTISGLRCDIFEAGNCYLHEVIINCGKNNVCKPNFELTLQSPLWCHMLEWAWSCWCQL